MNIDVRWVKLSAARGRTGFVWWPPRKRLNEQQAQKAELHEWENEGGNPAPSPNASDALVTTGCA